MWRFTLINSAGEETEIEEPGGWEDIEVTLSRDDTWKGIFVEVKTAKGVKSEFQREFEREALIHGYYYAVVRSIDDCKELLEKFKLNQI